ncbi:MAG: hypothetical protein KAS16_08490 [Thermoplasmata archaeon]|nr:hypothetical protein [Thermoplasmata archaeon]
MKKNMSICDVAQNCPFFMAELATRPGIAEMYKKIYCKGDYETCARYMVIKALGLDKTPDDLYPNMLSRAEEIVAKN